MRDHPHLLNILGSSESSSSVKTFLKKELRTSALANSVSIGECPIFSFYIRHPLPDLQFRFYVYPELFRILFDLAGNISFSYNRTALRHLTRFNKIAIQGTPQMAVD